MILLYADLQWATADSCRGSSSSSSGSGSVSGNDEGCTPDANPAQAGFSTRDGMRYFTVNGSGTDVVLSLNSTSNVGLPGVWIFQVDGDQVVSAGKPVIAVAFVDNFCILSDSVSFFEIVYSTLKLELH